MGAIIQNILYAISRITNPAPAGSSEPTLPETQDGITAYVDFRAYAASNPSYQEGRVFVNKDNKDLEIYKALSTAGGVNVSLLPHIVKVCQPEAVIPLAAGTPVRISGFDTTLGLPTVGLINTEAFDTAFCHGILLNDIYAYPGGEQQVTGYMATSGVVSSVYTGEDPISAGSFLYISESGDSVSTAPQSSLGIPVGIALESVEPYSTIKMIIRWGEPSYPAV